MLAEATEKSDRRLFLGHGQTPHDLAQPVDVRGKHSIEQGSPFGCQLAKDHALVFGGRSSTHQPSRLELLDHVGGTRTRHQNPIANLTERECALVIQHLEYRELSQTETLPGELWPYALFDRLVRACDGDDQLQGRCPIAFGIRFGLLRSSALSLFRILNNSKRGVKRGASAGQQRGLVARTRCARCGILAQEERVHREPAWLRREPASPKSQ